MANPGIQLARVPTHEAIVLLEAYVNLVNVGVGDERVERGDRDVVLDDRVAVEFLLVAWPENVSWGILPVILTYGHTNPVLDVGNHGLLHALHHQRSHLALQVRVMAETLEHVCISKRSPFL